MEYVYILLEERESSVQCCFKGVWKSWDSACNEMLRLINENELFSEGSKIDVEAGIAESDPNYTFDKYCNYTVLKSLLQ